MGDQLKEEILIRPPYSTLVFILFILAPILYYIDVVSWCVKVPVAIFLVLLYMYFGFRNVWVSDVSIRVKYFLGLYKREILLADITQVTFEKGLKPQHPFMFHVRFKHNDVVRSFRFDTEDSEHKLVGILVMFMQADIPVKRGFNALAHAYYDKARKIHVDTAEQVAQGGSATALINEDGHLRQDDQTADTMSRDTYWRDTIVFAICAMFALGSIFFVRYLPSFYKENIWLAMAIPTVIIILNGVLKRRK